MIYILIGVAVLLSFLIGVTVGERYGLSSEQRHARIAESIRKGTSNKETQP